jgi:hypothetical protein
MTKKVLGQLECLVTTLQDAYTVPAAKTAIVSTIIICNRTGGALTFRVAVAPTGAADALSQYIYYGQTLAANTSFASTIGIALGSGDVVRVWASGTGLSASVFGVEDP